MKYLLDTHTLIWSQDDTSRLSAPAVAILSSPTNDLVLSIVTAWEIGIKVALGKLALSKPFRLWIDTAVADLGLALLPISLDHIERQMALAFHHRDPFDRLLAAQSLVEGLILLSADAAFDPYGASRVWA